MLHQNRRRDPGDTGTDSDNDKLPDQGQKERTVTCVIFSCRAIPGNMCADDTLLKTDASYRVTVEPCSKRLQMVFAGEIIADSTDALLLHETRLPTVSYFPRKDVRMDLLQRTDHHTHCPFKGNASYWTLKAGNQVAENAAWSYEEPLNDARAVHGYLAFDWRSMDAWYVDGQRLLEQPRVSIPSKLNIFSAWFLSDAGNAASASELLLRLSHSLFSTGVPVLRVQILIRTLHPQVFATRYTWWRDTDTVETFSAPHEILETREYRESPYVPILEGAGGVRRSLEGPDARFDFPVLGDLHARRFSGAAAILPLQPGG